MTTCFDAWHGLAVGDLIRTSYGTGPYIVAAIQYAPGWGGASLRLAKPGTHGRENAGVINHVQPPVNGRYFTDLRPYGAAENDEVIVIQRGIEPPTPRQLALF